jgi:hypothetical protein
MNPVKITALEMQNVKRVRAVALELNETGLTVIGGRSDQGKTSILDGIKWMLGGDRYRPSNPNHDGEQAGGKITLSNGVICEIGGKNGTLKVSDPSGKRGGITLVQSFIGTFSLDLPAFMKSSDIEKTKMVLDLFPGLGKRLEDLKRDEKRMYDERTVIGQQKEQKAKHAADLPYNEDAPAELLTGGEMADQLRDAMAVNSKNKSIRDNIAMERSRLDGYVRTVLQRTERVAELERMLAEAKHQREQAMSDRTAAEARIAEAEAMASRLVDADTETVKQQMVKIDTINAKVRQNMEKKRAEDEASDLAVQYNDLSDKIDAVRKEKIALLSGVQMPMPELSINDEGLLVYRNQKWDCMSSSDQLIVGASICAAVKPSCGFVLLDGLERLDKGKLGDFGEWLVDHNLQGIGTRVSDGDECTIIIEDGVIALDASV